MSDDFGGSASGGDDHEEEGAKKKSPILLILVALVLIGGGAGAYFMGFLDPLLGKSATEVCTTDEHGVETCAPAPAAVAAATAQPAGAAGQVCTKDEKGNEVCSAPGAQFLKIPEMIVNLNSDDGTPRYLRLEVQLEFKNAADMAAVEKVMPRVVDQFQTYLRELRVKDLRGSAGIYRLQMELLSRVNQASYPVEVQGVLFQEILIQ
jgi:flagellar FliL protein